MTMAQIVSPPFACGVTWLVNVLLELGVKTTNPNFDPGHWKAEGVKTAIGESAWDHLRWHLPILHRTREFSFQPDLEVIWEHRLNFARAAENPTILYVRDPRDAIYSLYKRNYSDVLSYLDYLRRPDIWPDHFGQLFNLIPADTFAYFCFYWMNLAEMMNIMVVRFEDMRADPITVVSGVLDFLGAPRGDDEIERALAESNFKKAKEATQSCVQATGKQFATTRSGKVGEWRETHGVEELGWFEGPANSLMWKLGYEVASTHNYEQVASDFEHCLEHLPQASQLIFDTIQNLDHFGDAGMIRDTILNTSRLFPPSSMEKMWAGVFLESYDWINKIFSTEPEFMPQRNNAFRTFAALNGYFSPMPSQSFALKEAYAAVGYQCRA